MPVPAAIRKVKIDNADFLVVGCYLFAWPITWIGWVKDKVVVCSAGGDGTPTFCDTAVTREDLMAYIATGK